MKDLHSRKLKRVSLSSPSMKMAKYGVLDKMNSIKMDSVEKNSVGNSVGSTSKVQDSEGPDDKKGSSGKKDGEKGGNLNSNSDANK